MTLQDLIVYIIIAGAVVLILHHLYRDITGKRRGQCHCGCHCDSCPMQEGEHTPSCSNCASCERKV